MTGADEQLAAIGLLALRWFVVLRVQPHWAVAAGRAWWPVAAGLALLLAVMAPAEPISLDAGGWVMAVSSELLLGLAIGVVLSVPAYALLGGAAASAGALQTTAGPFVRLCLSGALVAAASLGLHHPAMAIAHDQALLWPPGQPQAWLNHVADLPALLSVQLDGMLVLALTLASPVLLTVLVVRAAVAAVGQGPDLSRSLGDVLGPAVAGLAAIVAFAASWAVYPGAWARGAVLGPLGG